MNLRGVGPIIMMLELTACRSGESSRDPAPGAAHAAATADPGPSPKAGVVDVVAHDFAFRAPDSIPSGWTTFRLTNRGAQTHFFVLDHLPEGKTLDDYVAAVAMPFDSAWSGLQKGTLDKAEVGPLLGRLLPRWFAGVEQTGGVGLLAPGHDATATVQLQPGTYVVECYVKTPDGAFHASLGMARQLTVTAGRTATKPPAADLEIAFTAHGMTAPAEVRPGRHTVAVHYRQKAEGLLANDVHVAQLPEGVDIDSVVSWMDWTNVGGLRAPAPVPFLGGVQEMPVGRAAYFTVVLTPGRYAWISENAERGMVKAFTVGEVAPRPGQS